MPDENFDLQTQILVLGNPKFLKQKPYLGVGSGLVVEGVFLDPVEASGLEGEGGYVDAVHGDGGSLSVPGTCEVEMGGVRRCPMQ